MNCKSKLQIKGETITVLFKFSANFPVPHFIKNKSLSTRHNRATCSTVHEVRFSRIAAWKQQQLYNTRQSPVNWRKYVMIRMVRVLRAKIEPQSGSKLSHTHAPEPARSTTTATCGGGGGGGGGATMDCHGCTPCTPCTPGLLPRERPLSSQWCLQPRRLGDGLKASANASASACCATGQCNNLRAAHRHLDSTWHNHNRQNQTKKKHQIKEKKHQIKIACHELWTGCQVENLTVGRTQPFQVKARQQKHTRALGHQ